MNATWTAVLQVLSSPAGQALLQSTEMAIVDAIAELFKHAAAADAPATKG